MLSPAHPAPELVELAQAEAVGVLHHHQRRVGPSTPHLDDGGGHQHVKLPRRRRHRRVLVPAFIFPWTSPTRRVGEHSPFWGTFSMRDGRLESFPPGGSPRDSSLPLHGSGQTR